MISRIVLFASLIAFIAGCKHGAQPETYQVVNYDGVTRQWTVLRTGLVDGAVVRKRLVVKCRWIRYGEKDIQIGDGVCSLETGKILIVNTDMPHEPYQSVSIRENNGQELYIGQGYGDGEIVQAFSVVKDELLPAK